MTAPAALPVTGSSGIPTRGAKSLDAKRFTPIGVYAYTEPTPSSALSVSIAGKSGVRQQGGHRSVRHRLGQAVAGAHVHDARAVLEHVPAVAVEAPRVVQGMSHRWPPGAQGNPNPE